MSTILALMATAFVAGVINSVAGGGTFLTFPALAPTGVPAITASATSSAALFPGTLASTLAFREDFGRLRGVNLPAMVAISTAGGLVGSLLLLLTPERTFAALVPALLLAATLLFAAGPWLTPCQSVQMPIGPERKWAQRSIVLKVGPCAPRPCDRPSAFETACARCSSAN